MHLHFVLAHEPHSTLHFHLHGLSIAFEHPLAEQAACSRPVQSKVLAQAFLFTRAVLDLQPSALDLRILGAQNGQRNDTLRAPTCGAAAGHSHRLHSASSQPNQQRYLVSQQQRQQAARRPGWCRRRRQRQLRPCHCQPCGGSQQRSNHGRGRAGSAARHLGGLLELGGAPHPLPEVWRRPVGASSAVRARVSTTATCALPVLGQPEGRQPASTLVNSGRCSQAHFARPLLPAPSVAFKQPSLARPRRPPCYEDASVPCRFGASACHWRKNLPELGQSCRAYAIDLLGYGYSDKVRAQAARRRAAMTRSACMPPGAARGRCSHVERVLLCPGRACLACLSPCGAALGADHHAGPALASRAQEGRRQPLTATFCWCRRPPRAARPPPAARLLHLQLPDLVPPAARLHAGGHRRRPRHPDLQLCWRHCRAAGAAGQG